MKPIYTTRQGQYQIKVLGKALRLLELFSEEHLELSTTELSEKLAFNKTTTFRIVRNLEELGYLEKNSEDGKYRLGIKLFFLGNLVRPYHYLRNFAKPVLKRLNARSGETVHLAIFHQGEALYLDKLEASHTIRVVISRVGHKLPAHCSGVGKVLLAYQPLEVVERLVAEKGLPAFTENTIRTWNRLKAELEEIRSAGFAYDNEEIELGLKCAAAPVYFGGRVIAAVSVSVPKERFDSNKEILTRMVVEAAHEISNILDGAVKASDSLQGDPARAGERFTLGSSG